MAGRVACIDELKKSIFSDFEGHIAAGKEMIVNIEYCFRVWIYLDNWVDHIKKKQCLNLVQ